jgi:hypothetical protein
MFCVRGLLVVIVILAIAPPSAAAEPGPAVPGWFVSGAQAAKYRAVVDRAVAYEGAASASLAAVTDAEGSEFGTLMQHIDARRFVGKRVRFSARIRTAGVTTGAAPWMRVDSTKGDTLAFDNLSRRGYVRGDRDWTRIDIVLEVPRGSGIISFGLLLSGEGMVWIDDVSLEPVCRQVATTGFPVRRHPRFPPPPDDLPRVPANLDFED